jgi:hypothetical protein
MRAFLRYAVGNIRSRDPEAFDETLTKADASKRIDALKSRLALVLV